jgi:hypothetical protein
VLEPLAGKANARETEPKAILQVRLNLVAISSEANAFGVELTCDGLQRFFEDLSRARNDPKAPPTYGYVVGHCRLRARAEKTEPKATRMTKADRATNWCGER